MQTNWNLKLILEDDSQVKIDNLKRISEDLINNFSSKYSTNNSYLENPTVLLQALIELENIQATDPANKLGEYFGLAISLDQSNPKLLAISSQLESWAATLGNKIQFFSLSLGKISLQKQQEFLQDVSLLPFHKLLSRIFDTAKYNLSESEEKILNTTSRFSKGNWVSLTSRLLAEEEIEGRNLSQLMSEISNIEKPKRDKAAKDVMTILDKHKVVAEVEINNIVNYKKEIDALRGISRPDLPRHIGDDVESEIVDTLRSCVVKNFDIAKDFYQLKSQLLGQKTLAYHERNVPYGSVEIKYNFEDSYKLVTRVFQNLDSEFAKVVTTYVDNGQVDVFPKKGKQSGAFCSQGAKNTPGFVMLNHMDKLTDVNTFAHEFGHAVNHEFMRDNNSAMYFGNSLAVAEVASTFFEDFVFQEVGKSATDEQRLSLNISKLNDDISTIIRQIACYEFENSLHQTIREKGYLSWQEIGKLFQIHMRAYMGDFVEQGPGSELFWIYWSHIRSSFYVYSYASGLLISKALQNMVKTDSKNIEKIKAFLKVGSRQSPKQVFAEIGIDITSPSFWNQGLLEVKTLLEETKTLAVKLGKI